MTFIARADPWALFIFFFMIYKKSEECQQVQNFPKISLEHPHTPKKKQMFFHGDDVILQDVAHLYKVDPITLNKKVMGKTAAEMASLKGLVKADEEMSTRFSDYCNGPCNEHCFGLYNDLLLCVTEVKLAGCPTVPKDDSQHENPQNCITHTPLAYLKQKNGRRKTIGVQLLCRSAKWSKVKRPLDTLKSAFLNFNNKTKDGKLTILVSKKIRDDLTINGMCSYGIKEILDALEDQYTLIYVKNQEEQWQSLTKDRFMSTPGLTEGFILNHFHRRTIIDFEFHNYEVFINYATTIYQALDGQVYEIFYFAISSGKILKIIVGADAIIDFHIWCELEGKIIQMKVWNEHILLVLTRKYLYGLPLHNCNSSLSCTKCIQDPHCLWDKKQLCLGEVDLKESEKGLKQDVLNGNNKKHCSTESESKDINNPDVLERLESKFETRLDSLEKMLATKNTSEHEDRAMCKELIKYFAELLKEQLTNKPVDIPPTKTPDQEYPTLPNETLLEPDTPSQMLLTWLYGSIFICVLLLAIAISIHLYRKTFNGNRRTSKTDYNDRSQNPLCQV